MLDKYVIRNEEGTAYRIIDGEAVIVNLEHSTFHSLNSVASFIWQQADGQSTVRQIVEKICQEFDVDGDTAERDCLDFLEQMLSRGLVAFLPPAWSQDKE